MLATIVDWGALGQVVALAFVVTLLLTTLFTTGVLFVEADERHAVTPARRALGFTAFALCAALVVVGLYVMFVGSK
jgi:Ca2+/H+ antiporter